MALNCNFMRLLTRDEPAVFFCTYLRSTDFLLRLFALTKQLHIGKLLWRGQETAPPLCEHTLKELASLLAQDCHQDSDGIRGARPVATPTGRTHGLLSAVCVPPTER